MNQQKLVKYVTLGIALFAAYKFAQKIFPGLHQVVKDTVRTGNVPTTARQTVSSAYASQRDNIIDVTPIRSTTK